MTTRGVGVGPNLEAREAIFELCRQLRAIKLHDERGDFYLTNADIVKGIQNRNESQVTPDIIQEVRKGKGKKYIPLLYQNLSALMNTHHITDSYALDTFHRLRSALDPKFETHLSEHFIRQRIQRCKKRVHIFNTYIPNLQEFGHALSSAPDVRIILMSPESRFMQIRAEELHEDIDSFHGIVKDQIRFIREKLINKEALRFYQGMPTTPFYIFDDEVYCGFFLHGRLAVDGPQRLYDATSSAGEILLSEFERMWKASKDLKTYRVPAARPKKVQALIDLMPSMASSVIPDQIEKVCEEISGVYLFARYRSSYAENTNNPIILGAVEIHPFSPEDGTITFTASLPNKKANLKDQERNRNFGWHNFSGVMIPYKNFLFVIGDDKKSKAPVFMALQRFDKNHPDLSVKPPQGLVLRRHPNGQIISSRVIFLLQEGISLKRLQATLTRDGTHLSETEFVTQYFNSNKDALGFLKSDTSAKDTSAGIMKMMDHISRADFK